MKHLLPIISLVSLVAISGCSTYATNRYSISADNVTNLKASISEKVSVGNFTATDPGKSSIMCRGVGPIKTPDGESFEEFVRNALVSEMKIADVYGEGNAITLTGNLDSIDFNSTTGTWNLGLTVNSSNGKSFSVVEEYDYTSSWYGETACNQTGQALMPAVQNLITKVIAHPEFATLLG